MDDEDLEEMRALRGTVKVVRDLISFIFVSYYLHVKVKIAVQSRRSVDRLSICKVVSISKDCCC